MKGQISRAFKKENISRFYMGPIYPAVIAAIVTLGSITGTEIFLNFIHTALLVGALSVCNSIRPLIISLCTYVYQISLENSPFYPNYSDYYVTSWRLPALIVVALLIASALVFFVVKNKIYKKISFKKTPFLISLLCLSAAFMLNGAFSPSWNMKNLILGASQTLIYLVLFVVIYHGFSDEEGTEDLAKYFAYISMLIALIISAELIHLYLSSDSVIVDGAINKVGVALGWGIWNLVGVSASVLIPMIFYGMAKNRYPWLYFSVAALTWIASVMTMSRNALVFSTLTFVACVLIFCFVGENKRIFRIITAIGALAALILAVALWDKIQALFADFFDRGLSDNGRFNLWGEAFDNFLASPVFGAGFYGFDVETAVFGPLPKMAHNTVLQLLSATGIVGFSAYVYYRIQTVIPFVKKPTLAKTMLGISILVLLAESLLDNFIFNFYPMFYATVALAIANRVANEKA